MSKRCQMSNSQTSGLWRRLTKKNNLTWWGSHILTSILMSDMKVIKSAQKYFLWIFWGFLVTIICDIKIDINVWTSLCQFIVFVNLLHSLGVQFFDIWHLFDNLTSFDILTHYLACTPLSLCLKPLYEIAHYAPLPMCPIPLYTIAPCAPLPMCPIPLYPIAHVPHTPVPHCPYPCTP